MFNHLENMQQHSITISCQFKAVTYPSDKKNAAQTKILSICLKLLVFIHLMPIMPNTFAGESNSIRLKPFNVK